MSDVSGRRLYYDAGVQRQNTGGVLATAPWVSHQEYVGKLSSYNIQYTLIILDAIPDDVKKILPEFSPKT